MPSKCGQSSLQRQWGEEKEKGTISLGPIYGYHATSLDRQTFKGKFFNDGQTFEQCPTVELKSNVDSTFEMHASKQKKQFHKSNRSKWHCKQGLV